MIGITQPRRVAAVSMAMRVEKELNVEEKGVVAYQVNFLLPLPLLTALSLPLPGEVNLLIYKNRSDMTKQ